MVKFSIQACFSNFIIIFFTKLQIICWTSKLQVNFKNTGPFCAVHNIQCVV